MTQFNMALVDAARPLMDRILQILPGAVIAGGYLRDSIMGRTVKDLDILIETSPTLEQLADLGRFLADDQYAFVEYELLSGDKDDDELTALAMPEYTRDAGRESHIEELFKGPGVDVIVTNNLEAHLREFPDNISKVFYDKDGLHMTAEFAEGHAAQRIVYRQTAPGARLERLKAKYPEYEVELA